MKTNSICISYLQYHSAKNALIPGGCEMILNTTQDPVSIHYHSSDYPSFVFWIRDLIPRKTYVYIYISLLYFIGFWVHLSIPCKSELTTKKNNGLMLKKNKKNKDMKWRCKESGPSTYFQASSRNVRFGNQWWPLSCEYIVVFPWLLQTIYMTTFCSACWDF